MINIMKEPFEEPVEPIVPKVPHHQDKPEPCFKKKLTAVWRSN